jgi:hypothetical protein
MGRVGKATDLIDECLGACDLRKETQIEFLIATVPDPIDSRFDYLFDRHVDALQRALEASGYILDRFSIPWLDGRPGKELQLSEDRSFETEPGVVLFRGKGAKPPCISLLVLFLVGETPTSGIHKVALESALDQIDRLVSDANDVSVPGDVCPGLGKIEPDAIRILGPTFSGSRFSLEVALQNWRKGRCKSREVPISIISGSATAIESDDPKSYSIADAKFQATVIPDGAVLESYRSYLSDRRIAPRQVALLVEANTAYGQAKGLNETGFRTIPFPLHVERLRVEAHDRQDRPDTKGPLDAHPLTSIPVEENRRAVDVIPPLSRLQAPTLEPLMQSIFRLIVREKIRYVGVLASDVRDLLFLAREFRSHCPNTALFTLNSDLLYLHPELNIELEGMQVLTTYPLFGPNRIWSPPYDSASRVQFSMDISVGVYNAALALLGKQELMVEYAPPLSIPQGGSLRPSLWVVAAGRDGFWPVRTLPWNNGQESYVFSVEAPGKNAEPDGENIESGLNSQTINLAFLLWCLGCSIGLWLLLRTQDSDSASSMRPDLRRWLRDSITPKVLSPLDYRRRFYFAASCTCLLLLHLLLCAIWSIPTLAAWRLVGWRTGRTVLGCGVGLFLISLLLILVAFIRTMILSRLQGSEKRWKALGGDRLSLIFVLVGCVVTLILLMCQLRSWARLTWLHADQAMLLYARAIAFRSGLSPLVPLFFTALGGLACTACVVRRLNRLETDREYMRTLAFDKVSEPISILERRVRHILACEAVGLPIPVWVAAIGVAAPASLFFGRFALPLDDKPFLILFVAGFFTGYLGLAFEFGRFVYGWQSLRKLLQRLSSHPVGHTFSMLREEDGLKLLPISQAGVSDPLSVIEHALERARVVVRQASQEAGTTIDPLRRLLGASLPGLKKSLCAAEISVGQASRASAEGNRVAMRKHHFEAQIRLWCIAVTVARGLHDHRSASGQAAPPQSKGESSSAASLEEAADRFLASQCVPFLTHVLAQLRNLVTMVTAGLLLMLIAATSYPFQPRNWILLFNWTVVLGAVVTTMTVFVQMNRNPILSALSGTEPGKTSWDRDFLIRVSIYGVVPVLSLLGAQFPETFGQLFSWVGTILGGH